MACRGSKHAGGEGSGSRGKGGEATFPTLTLWFFIFSVIRARSNGEYDPFRGPKPLEGLGLCMRRGCGRWAGVGGWSVDCGGGLPRVLRSGMKRASRADFCTGSARAGPRSFHEDLHGVLCFVPGFWPWSPRTLHADSTGPDAASPSKSRLVGGSCSGSVRPARYVHPRGLNVYR